MKEKFTVTGMTCTACSAHVERAVGKLDGVSTVAVNLMGNTMVVEHQDALSTAAIIDAVVAAGYGATTGGGGQPTTSGTAPQQSAQEELTAMKRRLIASFCWFIPLFYLSMGHMLGLPLPAFLHQPNHALTYALLQFLLVLPILYINDKYFKVGFKTLAKRAPNMDSLIAVGATAAVVYGIAALFQIGLGLATNDSDLVAQWSMNLYFESAGTILTLITLGKYLETRSKGKTSEAIARLIDLAPKSATVIRNGEEVSIPVEQVVVGDLIVVRPGQAVPVDGEIVAGTSSVDQSALTGESIPVDKTVGDGVIAASINRSGSFTFRATRVGEDTTLAQMIALVEEATASKAPMARLADKVAGIFVPVVMSISLITLLVWLLLGATFSFALTSAVAVLVISCPCALGLATPVAIMVGTGKGAEQGILIKSAQGLEALHGVDTVVLDKTGTVTVGHPRVTDILPTDGASEGDLLAIAASLEHGSEHPLGQAIVAEGKQRNLPLLPVTDFLAVHGRGISGTVDGVLYLAGNQAMMEEHSVALTDHQSTATALATQGKTPLFFAKDGLFLGIIALADTVKPTSAQAIQTLRNAGLDVVLLTGDNEATAQAIGGSLAVTDIIAQVLPADKERHIAALQDQGKKVAMVGDGINDGPALARADVGIAIGAGADIAIESADIVLMKSDLLDVCAAIDLSHAVIGNIRMNLFWAFFYNSIGIPLAAGVFYPLLGWQLSPMFAAAAMSFSSVSVVLNALRLNGFRPKVTREMQADEINEVQPIEIEGENNMEKKITIVGMSCVHCSGRVEQVLNAMEGVTARVDLAANTAFVTVEGAVSDDQLRQTVENAGYQVTGIS